MTAKLGGPGGVRAVIAENLLLKQELIVLRRGRQRASNLTLSDRLLCGFGSLFISPGQSEGRHRRTRLDAYGVSSVVGASQYHRLLPSEPVLEEAGPKGPGEALIRAIVEPEVAQSSVRLSANCAHHLDTFGVEIDKNVVCRVLSNTIAPPRAKPGLVVVPIGALQTACRRGPLSIESSCSGATGCSWSWTSSRVASSKSACTAVRSLGPVRH